MTGLSLRMEQPASADDSIDQAGRPDPVVVVHVRVKYRPGYHTTKAAWMQVPAFIRVKHSRFANRRETEKLERADYIPPLNLLSKAARRPLNYIAGEQ